MLSFATQTLGLLVNTTLGPVDGSTSGSVNVWRGIPFAATGVFFGKIVNKVNRKLLLGVLMVLSGVTMGATGLMTSFGVLAAARVAGTFISAGALEDGVATITRRRAAITHTTSAAAAPPSAQARRRGARSERGGAGRERGKAPYISRV